MQGGGNALLLHRQAFDERDEESQDIERIRAVHQVILIDVRESAGFGVKRGQAEQILVEGDHIEELNLAVAVHIAEFAGFRGKGDGLGAGHLGVNCALIVPFSSAVYWLM